MMLNVFKPARRFGVAGRGNREGGEATSRGMDVRGERECRDCGERWSYYETGAVRCPACGSVRSRGVGDRALHTDTDPELNLTEARERAAGSADAAPDEELREAARLAREAAREYLAGKGFVVGGELRPLDATYRRAAELRYVADEVERRLDVSEAVVERFLALLGDDEPGPPPEALYGAHGLAAAETVEDYSRELREWLDRAETGIDPKPALGRLREHVKRLEALDGNVDPAEADALVAVARDIGRACREEDPASLAAAESALDTLGNSG